MFDTNQPWQARLPLRVRSIDAGTADGGGGDGDRSGTDDADAGSGIDWKAKFEAERAHSREWEKRAKDNKTAADELEILKESRMSETERTARRIRELEAANAAYEAEKRQTAWKAQVSKATGVPVELLHGDSLEAMTANAKAIDQYAHPKPKGMPNQGRTPSGTAAGADERAWVGELFSNL